MNNPLKTLNTPAISAKGVLIEAGINPAKYYDVKRGKSSFSHEETDKILVQIHTLKTFPQIPRKEFLDFLRNDKRIVTKHVLADLTQNQYLQFMKDLRADKVSNKRHTQIATSFARWQATLPNVKDYIIKKEIRDELSIRQHTITDFKAFIDANFTPFEVQFYRISDDDMDRIQYLYFREA